MKLRETKGGKSVIDQLRDIVDSKQASQVKDPVTKKRTKVDMTTANAVVKVYDQLSAKNQKQMQELPLQKIVDIAWKLIK